MPALNLDLIRFRRDVKELRAHCDALGVRGRDLAQDLDGSTAQSREALVQLLDALAALADACEVFRDVFEHGDREQPS